MEKIPCVSWVFSVVKTIKGSTCRLNTFKTSKQNFSEKIEGDTEGTATSALVDKAKLLSCYNFNTFDMFLLSIIFFN